MINPQYIVYGGKSNMDLNVDIITCVSFDSDNGEMTSFLNREGVVGESHDGRYKRVTRYKYSESFSPKFTFVKKDFSDFKIDEVRTILKYLTSKDTTALLEVYYEQDDTKTEDQQESVASWVAIGGWTEISTYKLANNRTVGITATFESVTPYALSPIYTVPIKGGETKTIKIETDEPQYPVCPKITIQQTGLLVNIPTGMLLDPKLSDMVENTVYFNGSTYYWKSAQKQTSDVRPDYSWPQVKMSREYDEKDVLEKNVIYYYEPSALYVWIEPLYFQSSSTNPNLETTSVKIVNTHSDLLNPLGELPATITKNNTSSEQIILDGTNKITSSNRARRIFGDDFNWQWLELYDGTNDVTVEGNCEITLEYRCPRKVGEF